MVSVKVLFFATFRDRYGVKELNLEFDGSLEDFLRALSNKIGPRIVEDIYDPEAKQFRNDLIVMINGRNVKDLKEIKFKDNDEIAIFPPLAGG